MDTKALAVRFNDVLADLRLECIGVEFTPSHGQSTLRVYLDLLDKSEPGEAGADGERREVGIEDCETASRELSAKLDASDVMGEMPYTLEVSSPGVDRPLTQPRHWQRAAGRLVRVPLTPSGAGHAKPGHGKPGAAAVQGRVVAADAAGVTLDIDGAHRRFDYAALGAGMVQIEFDRPGTTPDPGEPEEDSPAGKRGPQRRGPGAEPDGH